MSAELDWPTLRAVSVYFDVDPHQVQQALQSDRPRGTDTGEWCEMPIHRTRRDYCSRPGHVNVFGYRMCWQHENTFLNVIAVWLRNHAETRDLSMVVETIGSRLRDLSNARTASDGGRDADVAVDARLRQLLTTYIDRDTAHAARRAVTEMFEETT